MTCGCAGRSAGDRPRSEPEAGDDESDLSKLVDGSEIAEGQDIADGPARTLMSKLAGVRHRLAAELVPASTLGLLRGTFAEAVEATSPTNWRPPLS